MMEGRNCQPSQNFNSNHFVVSLPDDICESLTNYPFVRGPKYTCNALTELRVKLISI